MNFPPEEYITIPTHELGHILLVQCPECNHIMSYGLAMRLGKIVDGNERVTSCPECNTAFIIRKAKNRECTCLAEELAAGEP